MASNLAVLSVNGSAVASVKEDLRVGKTLLERFEEGKKILRPEVAEAGIVVLDALIARLKNFRSGLKKTIDDRRQEIVDLQKQIDKVAPSYNKVRRMHDAHVAERDQLQKEVSHLTGVLDTNCSAASDLIYKANRAHGVIRTHMASSLVDFNRDFTSSGRALPGREDNLLRRPVQAANTRVP
jgi:chromosome segregation ATPase